MFSIETLETLRDLEASLAKTELTNQKLTLLLDTAISLTNSDTGEIVILSVDEQSFWIRAARTTVLGMQTPVGLGFHTRVFQSTDKVSMFVNDIQDVGEFKQLLSSKLNANYKASLRRLGPALGAIVHLDGKRIGVLCLAREKRGLFYTRDDAVVSEFLANRASSSLSSEWGYEIDHSDSDFAKSIATMLAITRRDIGASDKSNQCLYEQLETAKLELYQQLAKIGMAIPGTNFASIREVRSFGPALRHRAVEPREQWPPKIIEQVEFANRITSTSPSRPFPMNDNKPVEFDFGWSGRDCGGMHAVLERKPYSFETREQAEHYEEYFQGIQSHVSVPIMLNQDVALVWTLESNKFANFRGRIYWEILEIASQAEVVLRWLYQSRFLSTVEFENTCGQAKNIRTFSKDIAEHFRQIFNLDDVTVYLASPCQDFIETTGTSRNGHSDVTGESNWIYSLQSIELPTSESGRLYLGQWINSLTAKVLHRKTSIYIADLSDPTAYTNAELKTFHRGWDREWFRDVRGVSFLGIPITSRNEHGQKKVIGVIRMGGRRSMTFSEDEIAFAERLAERFGLAIERVRFAQRQQIAANGIQIEFKESLFTTAEHLVEWSMRQLPCKSIYIRLADEENNLQLVAIVGDQLEGLSPTRAKSTGVSEWVYEHKKIVVIQDTDFKDGYFEKIRRKSLPDAVRKTNILSMACAPILIEDKCIGTISFQSGRRATFKPEWHAPIQEIAFQCSQALARSIGTVGVPQGVPHTAMEIATGDLLSQNNYVSNQRVKIANTRTTARNVARAFASLIPQAYATVWLFNNEKNAFECKAVAPGRLSRPKGGGTRLSVSQKGFSFSPELLKATGLDIKGNRIWTRFDDLPQKQLILDSLNDNHRNWVATVDLIGFTLLRIESEVVGAIICYTTKEIPTAILPNDMDRFEDLANHSKLVFGTVRWIEKLRQIINLTETLAVFGSLMDAILHHLIQPLHNMSTAMPELMRLVEGDSEAETELQFMQADLKRMSQDIVDLKELVANRRLSTGRKFDIAAMLRKIVSQTRGQFRVIGVKSIIPNDILMISGIAPFLEAGIRMVIQNGVDAMPNGGELEIELVDHEAAGDVSVLITDFGEGMPEQVAKNAFRQFYSTKSKGGGMGLTIALAACKWHHGTVRIVRTELGKGTTIEFRLPKTIEVSRCGGT